MSENSIAQAESKIWGCPEEDCGYHIADGPAPEGEPSTDALIGQHLEEHAFVDARGDADAAERRELEAEAAAEAPEQDPERAAYTQGLREVADWLDAHPEVELPYLTSKATGTWEPTLTIMLGSWSDDQREQMATTGRAMGQFAKHANPDGDRFAIYRRFAGIALAVTADRDEVCERVVVSTKEVTEEVPDPEALKAVPTVTVTKTVEEVRWECRPLLAEPTPAVAA